MSCWDSQTECLFGFMVPSKYVVLIDMVLLVVSITAVAAVIAYAFTWCQWCQS
jgi:hypothetical protein